jgi:signal transduction histidine kinase
MEKMLMKSKIILITIVTLLLLTGAMLAITMTMLSFRSDTTNRDEIVALNEIEQLVKADSIKTDEQPDSLLTQAIRDMQKHLKEQSDTNRNRKLFAYVIIIYTISVTFIIGIFLYVYCVILRPFQKLSGFASEVAGGNFESPLYYERTNLFGAFTWAFDNMRKEVMKARKCEKEAIDNNKTVIATISHDIKTPIASIRAYSEGLQANMDYNTERRQRYLSVIMRKCDEVSKLTNDLFLHSLSDLDRLMMNCESYQARQVIGDILLSVSGDNPRVKIQNEIPETIILIDSRRLEQVFENLIGNAIKYSGDSDIELFFETEGQYLQCHIRDYGDGIIEEDLPFVFDKFYRGRNSRDLPGSGLGLYIVKYIVEQMDGSIRLINRHPGLEAIIRIKLFS